MSTAQASESLLTAEEFYRFPEPPDAGKVELVDGRAVIHVPVSGKHGQRQVLISRVLDSFARSHKLGEVSVETGYVLARDPDLVRSPDVSFITSAALPEGELPEEGFVSGPPLLAVEVVSPNDRERDVLEKVADYLDQGVSRVWAVRAKTRSVVIYYPNGEVKLVPNGGVLTSFDAPGFELPVADIFD